MAIHRCITGSFQEALQEGTAALPDTFDMLTEAEEAVARQQDDAVVYEYEMQLTAASGKPPMPREARLVAVGSPQGFLVKTPPPRSHSAVLLARL